MGEVGNQRKKIIGGNEEMEKGIKDVRSLKLSERLRHLSKDKLLDYIDVLNRNFWNLQGQYVLAIEQKYGMEAAMELDGMAMGKNGEAQVHRYRKFFKLGNGISDLVKIMDYSQAFSNMEYYYPEITDQEAILTVTRCPMQDDRKQAGMPDLSCKSAGVSGIGRVAKAINQNIEMTCTFCPPDKHPEDAWCQWEFRLKD